MNDLSFNIILDSAKVDKLCELASETNKEKALAMHADRMLNRTFEQLQQQGSMPLILSGKYNGSPILMKIGSGICGLYSGPETNHQRWADAGMLSMRISGDVNLAELEAKVRTYFNEPEKLN
jgi:hypothetical protein